MKHFVVMMSEAGQTLDQWGPFEDHGEAVSVCVQANAALGAVRGRAFFSGQPIGGFATVSELEFVEVTDPRAQTWTMDDPTVKS